MPNIWAEEGPVEVKVTVHRLNSNPKPPGKFFDTLPFHHTQESTYYNNLLLDIIDIIVLQGSVNVPHTNSFYHTYNTAKVSQYLIPRMEFQQRVGIIWEFSH